MTSGRTRRVEPVSVTVSTSPLSTRHWRLVGLALVGVAALFLLLSWFTPRYPLSSGLVSLLSDSVFEDDVHTYARVLEPSFPEADVVILGSSNVRLALWDAGELTRRARLLDPALGRIEKVTTAGQSFLDALFLLSEARLRPGQLVVLHVAPSTFARGFEDERLLRGIYIQPSLGLAVRYGAGIEELAALLEPGRRLPMGIHNLRQLLHRSLANLPGNFVKGRVYGLSLAASVSLSETPLQDPAPDLIPNDIVQTRIKVGALLKNHFQANGPYNVKVLDSLLDHLARNEVRVVLMETALIDGDEKGYLAPFWQQYRAAVTALAERHSVPYVDLNDEVTLGYGDFLDARHTNSQGRRKWSERFLTWLGEQNRVMRR